MSSFQQLTIEYTDTADSFRSVCDLSPLGLPAINNFLDYVGGVAASTYPSKFTFYTGAVKATATMTVTSTGSANDETCVVAGVTFTAKTSGATGNQFNISTTPATQAANMVAAFNASSDLSGIVTATSLLGVVTITSVVPGVVGNGLVASDALANVATVSFTGGSNGTAYTIDRL